MKRLIKYIVIVVFEIAGNYSFGQLNLSAPLAAGQYFDPVKIHAEVGTSAHGSSGEIHLFIDNTAVSEFAGYATQLSQNILSSEASEGHTIPNTSLPVGKIPYSYGVSPSGGAAYTVPIVIPPGTMGMVPNLSIVYNSQAADGLLGYGWNLSGLSCISRSGKTPYHNYGATYPDQTQGITLTNSDWFALDGNRLIKTSGSYGANGTNYATESETFNLVTSNGTVGSGPEWFQVQTKNGLTIEYGHSLDSRLVPVGQNTVLVWYIDKITDQFGNYYTFRYTNNNGEVNIQEIDYTGNANIGLTPYNSIVFSYVNRQDPNTTYVAGGALNTSVVLNSITINSHGTFFKEYSFQYAYNVYTLLQEIDETSSDHSALNPLQFSYGSDAPYAGSECSPTVLSNNCVEANPSALGGNSDGLPGFQEAAQFTLLDYNGDGKEDVISLDGVYSPVIGGEEHTVLNEYQLSWNSQTLYTTGTTCPYFSANAYSFPSRLSSGTPTSMGSTIFQNPVNNNSVGSLSQYAGDFNGDGKDDYAVSIFHTNAAAAAVGADAEEDILVALSTGTSFAIPDTVKAYDMYSTPAELSEVAASAGTTLSGTFYIDLNGDGQLDIFNYHYDPVGQVEYYRVWLNAGASVPTPQEQPSSSYTVVPTPPTSPNFEITVKEANPGIYLDFSQAIPMDLNGDGKTELVNVIERGPISPQKVIVGFDGTETYGQSNYVAESDGTISHGIPGNGMVVQQDNSPFQYNNNTYTLTDSIYTAYEAAYNASVTYNAYFPVGTYGHDNVYGKVVNIDNSGAPYVLYGDFNGDGITDVLTYSNATHLWTMNFGEGGGYYSSLPVSTLSSDNPFSYPTHYYLAHDVNGDGKTDILEFTPSGSGGTVINTYYSTGTSFVAGQPITLASHDINPQTWQLSFGDFNGDGVDDLLLENNIGDGNVNGAPVLLYFYTGTQSRRMVESTDGYGQTVQLTYQPITNSNIYSQPQASNYRSNTNSSNLLDIQEPIYVVSRLTTIDGTGNHTTTSLSKDGNSNYITYTDTNSTTYTYQDAIYSKLGLGILGFLNVTSYNLANDYSTSLTYTVSPTFDNMVPSTSSVTDVSSATLISDGTYTYTPVSLGGLRYFLPETESVTNDDIANVTNTTTYTYTSDNHGNLQEKNTQISSSSGLIETSDVQNTYTTSATWIPAAVATSTTTVTYMSNPAYTRALLNNWDGAGHLLYTEIDPATSEAVYTTNTYDPNTGVVLSQSIHSTDPTCVSQTNSFTYDLYYQFKTSSTNTLGQVTQYTYNPMWGKPASVTTPDGLTTTYSYDAYGRSSQITTPDGLTQTLTYGWVTAGELPIGGSDPFDITATSLYSVTSQKNGSPSITTFYDWLDRPTSIETSTMSGTVFKEQAYDALGHDYLSTNVYQKTSIPATYGDYDPVTITKLYADVLHRLTSATSTCASAPTLATSYSYTTSSGNSTVTVSKPDGSSSSQTNDPAGLLINSTDYLYSSPGTPYSTVNYAYFSNGKPSSIVLNGTTVNTFQYDAYGRQTQLSDINFVNNYVYQYNAYNQLVSQQDPNGDTYTITYDAIGRTTQKVSSKEGTYTYTYVNSGNGLDLLQSEQLGSSTVSYTYDHLRRPTQLNVNGLTTTYTYDSYNHVATKTYPGGFEISNTYNTSGYLTAVAEVSGPTIWQAEYMNPAGQYVDYLLGNGVHTTKAYTPYGLLTNITGGSYENMNFNFDPTNGNLLSRIDNTHAITESFSYDGSLNSRLVEAQAYHPCTSVAGESPTLKTADVTMNYDAGGNIENKLDICAPSTNYTNGNTNNQVTAVPNSNSIVNPGQSVTYTSFNAPLSIALGNYTLDFTYGPDNNREITNLTDNLGNTTTRYYANSYEKTLVNGTNPTEVNYIQCGGDLVGMFVYNSSGSGIFYVYSDNVGSILTVTNGTHTFSQSFDAWGNYRNPTTGAYAGTPPAGNPAWLYRGFTGHEHLTQMQLINMNGRLYDPFINSTLSPDITVQAPTNTQNYNRYSYCLNNPLKYSDPTGFMYNITPAMQASQMAAQQGLDEMEDEWNLALSYGDEGGGGSENLSGDGGGDGGDGSSGGNADPTGNTGTSGDQTSNGGGPPNAPTYTLSQDELGNYTLTVTSPDGSTVTCSNITTGSDGFTAGGVMKNNDGSYSSIDIGLNNDGSLTLTVTNTSGGDVTANGIVSMLGTVNGIASTADNDATVVYSLKYLLSNDAANTATYAQSAENLSSFTTYAAVITGTVSNYIAYQSGQIDFNTACQNEYIDLISAGASYYVTPVGGYLIYSGLKAAQGWGTYQYNNPPYEVPVSQYYDPGEIDWPH